MSGMYDETSDRTVQLVLAAAFGLARSLRMRDGFANAHGGIRFAPWSNDGYVNWAVTGTTFALWGSPPRIADTGLAVGDKGTSCVQPMAAVRGNRWTIARSVDYAIRSLKPGLAGAR
jgi:hypothetical protein